MVEKLQTNPDIYRIDIPLIGNALKNLNCYVLKSADSSVVIDTGFNRQECKEALTAGLEELGIRMDHTNLLITHLHSDHMGLAAGFAAGDSSIYMGKREYEFYKKGKNHAFRRDMDAVFRTEGFPEEELAQAARSNPVLVYDANVEFEVITVEDGDQLTFGDLTFTALEMPGHTPGHICYYLEKEKIMFLGDHILFDVTPNITIWPGVKDSLSTYLTNLHRLLTYEIKVAYPSHRGLSDKSLEERVQEITQHHSERLNEIMEVISKNPGCSGYEIAARLTWSLHGESFDSAPRRQVWFAVGEAMAHIEYLLEMGKVFRGNKIISGKPVHTYFLSCN